MAEPIRLVHTAYALVDGHHRPAPGEAVTIALRGPVCLEIVASVEALEITDDGEIAVLVDDTGCRWAMPVQPLPERAA